MPGVLSTLPSDYGYVLLVGSGSVLVALWLGINVGKARKQYGVEYPDMYSDKKEFNCIQRAHQNYLENYPMFLFNMLVSGLEYPRLAAGLGTIYVISRISYARGYYTGEPEKRNRGLYGMPAAIGLMALTVVTGFRQLACCPCGFGKRFSRS